MAPPATSTTGGGVQGLSGAFLIRSAREGNFMIQSYVPVTVTVTVDGWVLEREREKKNRRRSISQNSTRLVVLHQFLLNLVA